MGDTSSLGSGVSVRADGWLHGARFAPSPHADARPPGTVIALIVVHGASLPPGEFGSPWLEDFFCGRLDASGHDYFHEIGHLRVAPHLLIRRNGELVQFVSCERRAWHAGRSRWQGREECNDFSIGIELEGTDEIPYTNRQYACLEEVILALRAHYPGIGTHGVAGHCDIAPGRKTDPGSVFDWCRLEADLACAGYNFVHKPTKNGDEAG